MSSMQPTWKPTSIEISPDLVSPTDCEVDCRLECQASVPRAARADQHTICSMEAVFWRNGNVSESPDLVTEVLGLAQQPIAHNFRVECGLHTHVVVHVGNMNEGESGDVECGLGDVWNGDALVLTTADDLPDC